MDEVGPDRGGQDPGAGGQRAERTGVGDVHRDEVDVGTGSATFTGNVSLAKGDLHVTCPRIEVKFDTSPHVSWAKGSGGVSADVRGVHAEAPEVELDLTKQILELRGGVRLTRGQGWLQAEKASIDIATAKVTLAQVKGSIPVPPRAH